MNWNDLDQVSLLDKIDQSSQNQCVLIFKHSSRCSISEIAFRRLREPNPTLLLTVQYYFLDLIKHKDISNEIAERYRVHHESPQVLLIKDGECIYECSHLDIISAEIEEQINIIEGEKRPL